jgi:flagellar basal body P-ring protein FlgI
MTEQSDKGRAAKVEFQMALANLVTELQKLGVTKQDMIKAKESLKQKYGEEHGN